MRRAQRLGLLLGLALLIALGRQGTARAHAYIERATPPDGSAMTTPPSEIRLVYTEPVEPSLATLTLYGRDGKPVPGTRLESEGNLVLLLRLPPLSEGPYTLLSKVLGADGHVTEETVSFYVGTPPPNWKASAPAVPGVAQASGTAQAVLGVVLLLLVLGTGIALTAALLRKHQA